MNTIVIRSSSMARFMNCSGSVDYRGLPEEESDYAKEGTAFHEYLEQCFKGGPEIAQASNGVTIDDDMKYHAKKILPMIPKSAKAEMEIKYNPAGNIEVIGHVDYHWEEDEGRTLVVMDIKYGHRVVEAEKNWQLTSYGIGILLKYQKQYETIKLRIIQPRAHHFEGPVRTWNTTVGELERRYIMIGEKCSDYLQNGGSLATSSSCRYCPAAKEACPAFNAAFYNAVDFVKDHVINDKINNESLAQMLKTYDRIADILKIKSDAIKDLAKERLLANEVIPGYAAVKQYGHRKWLKSVNPETFKALSGFDMMKQVQKSPMDLEKEKIDESILDAFVEKEFKGYKIEQMDINKLGDQVFGNPNKQ